MDTRRDRGEQASSPENWDRPDHKRAGAAADRPRGGDSRRRTTGRLAVPGIVPYALLAVLVVATARPALAGSCSVPGDHADLGEALIDTTCDPIQLGPGTFNASVGIDRDVTLSGAGSGATTLLGAPEQKVLTVASPALVQLVGLELLVHPDSVDSSALGKATGATVGLSDVRIGISGPLPRLPPLDDAVALWNFANVADSAGRESDFATSGSFTVGDSVALPASFATNADGFAASEGPIGDCSGSWGTIFDVPGSHELATLASGSMTMWARVRFGAFGGNDDIFRFGSIPDPTMSTYELELASGQARFAVLGAGDGFETSVTHTTPLSTDSWFDVSGVFDSVAQEIRVAVHDPATSNQVGSEQRLTVPFSSLDLPESLIILFLEAPFDTNGCNQGAQLEMAAVWNRALSSAEIQNLSCGPACVFADGFETGDVGRWSP